MKEYGNKDQFNRRKRRKKSKRHALHELKYIFLVLCCCLTVTVLAIGFIANDFQFTKTKQPNAHPTPNTATHSDFKANLAGHVQSKANSQSNVDETTWCLILVNKWNLIPDGYEVDLIELANGQLIDKRIYPALQEMFDAARSNGVYPVVASGFRTAERQRSLMDEKIAEYRTQGYSAKDARTKAEEWVAIPETSEHQLGIAVDVNADGIHSTGKEVYKWLVQNAYKFGFIRRYPPDKTEITGVINEPWHYRYVGVKAATEIQNQGVCLEEYLNRSN